MEENSHVDPIDLIEYARGGLSRPVVRRVREHCLGCAECGDQLAAILLLRERADVRPATPPRRSAAAAAVLVIALGLGWLAVGGLPDDGPGDARIAEVESSPDGSAPAEAVAVEGPWSPRHERVFPLAVRIYAGDRAGAAPATSGALDARSPANDAVRRALAAGRNTLAADLASDPTVDSRLAGVAYYLDGRIDEARRRLAPIVEPPSEGFIEAPPLDRFAVVALAGALAELGHTQGLKRLLADWVLPESADDLARGLDRLSEFAGR